MESLCILFGCCEDVCCTQLHTDHCNEFETEPFCRKLCEECEVPKCADCWLKLSTHDCQSSYRDGGTILMSISNDHYYGHVNRLSVENNVTWLECAATCLVWSTMLVYNLETPYGHRMEAHFWKAGEQNNSKRQSFSFSMPWEDIENFCHHAVTHTDNIHKSALQQIQNELGVPHSEETLALLVNVHIVGGNKDLALHLKGLTMRVHVLQRLVEILRANGYPGYDNRGVNSAAQVACRLDERYIQKYGHASFTPAAVQEAVHVRHLQKHSIVQEKVGYSRRSS